MTLIQGDAQTRQRRHPVYVALISLVVALLAISSMTIGATRSDAATEGYMMDYGGWLVGSNRLASGEIVYCIEPGALAPAGAQITGIESDELRGYSFSSYNATGWSGVVTSDAIRGEPLRRINYVLSVHGTTANPREAVAVQFAVWILRDQPGEAAYLSHHMAWVENHGGAPEIARAHELVAESHLVALESFEAIDPQALEIDVDEGSGSGTVAYPEGTTSLEIAGAVFADGSTRLEMPSAESGEVSWVATPHAQGWQAESEVSVTGTWAQSGAAWPAKLELHRSEISSEQHLAWTVGPVQETVNGEFEAVVTQVNYRFEPTLSTHVLQQILGAGDRFSDTVTLSSERGSADWPSRTLENGVTEWLPLNVEGVLYGPFAQQQEVTDEAPQGAPVAGELQLIATEGPGSYEVQLPTVPAENGYYYWVWEISAAHQTEAGGTDMLPNGYIFRDKFGLLEEMHLVYIPEAVQPEEPTVPERPEEPITPEDPVVSDEPEKPESPTVRTEEELAETGLGTGLRSASALGLGVIGLGAVAMIIAGVIRSRKNLQDSRSPHGEVS